MGLAIAAIDIGGNDIDIWRRERENEIGMLKGIQTYVYHGVSQDLAPPPSGKLSSRLHEKKNIYENLPNLPNGLSSPSLDVAVEVDVVAVRPCGLWGFS